MNKNKPKVIESLAFDLKKANENKIEPIFKFVYDSTEKDYVAFFEVELGIIIIMSFVDDSKGIKIISDDGKLASKLFKKHSDIRAYSMQLALYKDDLSNGYLTQEAMGKIIRGAANLVENTPIKGPFFVPKSIENKLDQYLKASY